MYKKRSIIAILLILCMMCTVVPSKALVKYSPILKPKFVSWKGNTLKYKKAKNAEPGTDYSSLKYSKKTYKITTKRNDESCYQVWYYNSSWKEYRYKMVSKKYAKKCLKSKKYKIYKLYIREDGKFECIRIIPNDYEGKIF